MQHHNLDILLVVVPSLDIPQPDVELDLDSHLKVELNRDILLLVLVVLNQDNLLRVVLNQDIPL